MGHRLGQWAVVAVEAVEVVVMVVVMVVEAADPVPLVLVPVFPVEILGYQVCSPAGPVLNPVGPLPRLLFHQYL